MLPFIQIECAKFFLLNFNSKLAETNLFCYDAIYPPLFGFYNKTIQI